MWTRNNKRENNTNINQKVPHVNIQYVYKGKRLQKTSRSPCKKKHECTFKIYSQKKDTLK